MLPLAAGTRVLVKVMVQSLPEQPGLLAGILKTIMFEKPVVPATASASRKEQSASQTPSFVSAVLVTTSGKGSAKQMVTLCRTGVEGGDVVVR